MDEVEYVYEEATRREWLDFEIVEQSISEPDGSNRVTLRYIICAAPDITQELEHYFADPTGWSYANYYSYRGAWIGLWAPGSTDYPVKFDLENDLELGCTPIE